MAKDLSLYLEAEGRVWNKLGVEPYEHWVKLSSGGEVRVQELGEGPPVIFLHGGSVAGTSWAHLAARLTGVRSILIDRPGCGLSDMIDWAHTDTMRNEISSSPKIFTPIQGPNPDALFSDDLLAKLTMPVLFLWGENDPNGGAAIGRKFAPRLPNSQLIIVPEAEHAPWIDELDFCVEQTQSFLG